MAERTVDGKRKRVAIIGGGCAGISAAWQLSQQPDKFEIHVYEKSWRLGGKGASVRNTNGRVLERGLHVWLGFYENAFRMMRECYAEVERCEWGPYAKDPGTKLAHGRIDDAFFPEPHVGVGRPGPNGDWDIWSGFIPPEKGLPGEPLDERTNPFTLANYLLRCFDLLKTLMLSVIGPPAKDVPGEPRPNRRSTSDEKMDLDFSVDATTSAEFLIERMARMLRAGSLTGAAVLLQAVTMLEVWLQSLDFAPQVAGSAVKLMEAVAAQTRKLLRDITSIDPQIRMKTEIIDIVLTIAVGLFRDRVLFDDSGLDSINQFDYRDWLLQHGATKTSVDSRFLSGIYDFVFAYRDGNKKRPALAAGVALRGALRMFFTYRGSMFWRIRSGMGDAVFAPLYKVLLLRDREMKGEDGKTRHTLPVQFHFLHELQKVCFDVPSSGMRYVSSLQFRIRGEEAGLDKSSANALDDSGSWPDGPEHRFAKELQQGIAIRELSLGKEFDGVIFAMGIDDFKKACTDSIWTKKGTASTLSAEWARMCDEVKTVATKSAQVWLNKDIGSLGWYRGSGLFTALSGGSRTGSYDRDLSFDTWADMTHTLATEREWRAQKTNDELDKARSLAYFCAALPESQIKKLREKVRSEILSNLNKLVDEIRDTKRAPVLQGSDLLARARAAIMDPTRVASGMSILQMLQGSIEVELNDLEKSLVAEARHAPSREKRGDLLSGMSARIEDSLVKKLLEEKVDADLTRMLTREMRPIWPAAFESGSNALKSEIARHVEANFEGSNRYTLSPPGSLVHRISPLDRSVENMTIAGDWTACGLDAGCVEAAVMSGMLAAYAVSGEPDPKSIIGYDHP